jgi:hypothetical protein
MDICPQITTNAPDGPFVVRLLDVTDIAVVSVLDANNDLSRDG